MNIIQVISYFYPAWSYGGPGKLVYDLVKELALHNHRVTIFSTDALSETGRRTIKDNKIFPGDSLIKSYFFPNLSNNLAFKAKIFFPLINLRELNEEIKNSDRIHIHEFFTPLALMMSLFAQKWNKPYLISAHGTLDSFHLSHRKNFKRVFIRLFGNNMLKNTRGFIAATKEEIIEYQMLGIPENKIVLVNNGIDFTPYEKMPLYGTFRKKYKINPETLLLVFLGRINKLKGLDLLMEAFSKLKVKRKTKLIIAGSDDGYLEEIKNRAATSGLAGSVLFPGIMSGKDKLEMYSDSNLFIYPSPAEGFSVAILEAGASGLPLLISQGCKFPEVGSSGSGIVVPFKRDAFLTAMKKILINKNLREKMGRNARYLVKNNYTIKTMSGKLINVYKGLS